MLIHRKEHKALLYCFQAEYELAYFFFLVDSMFSGFCVWSLIILILLGEEEGVCCTQMFTFN